MVKGEFDRNLGVEVQVGHAARKPERRFTAQDSRLLAHASHAKIMSSRTYGSRPESAQVSLLGCQAVMLFATE